MSLNTNKKYNIGLDIGTTSVGWAVTDADGQKLLKAKNKNLWGVSLFEAGKTAAERRGYRSTRRRLNHRKFRLRLLEDMFEKEILSKDPSFFIRLKEAFLSPKDEQKQFKGNILFNDKDYTDADYYEQYKTIYHLRYDLISQHRQFDIREVYLAIHHLIKYRGHFIYEDQTFTTDGNQLQHHIKAIITMINSILNRIIIPETIDINVFEKTLLDRTMNRSSKVKFLIELTGEDKQDKPLLKELFNLIVGLKAKPASIFEQENLATIVETMNMSTEQVQLDLLTLADVLADEEYDLLLTAQKIYSAIILDESMDGYEYFAEAKKESYRKHQEELVLVKKMLKSNAITNDERAKFEYFYTDYIGAKSSNYEESKIIKKGLSTAYKNYSKEERLFKHIELLLAKENVLTTVEHALLEKNITIASLLPLQRSSRNAVIPYQVHEKELVAILENQATYYPFLLEQKDNIHKLLTFRIPYYVGPLADQKDSEFAWMVRKQAGKITPFNFEEMVDIDASSEAFIKRMTNKCTYLIHEDVIPKHSFSYAKFEVLNELNKIRLDGKPIDIPLKKRIFEGLFLEKTKVTHTSLKKWLAEHEHMTVSVVQGTQKETEFATSLQAFHRFVKIFDRETVSNPANEEMFEKIIYWSTVFEDKKIMRRKLSEYPQLTEQQQVQLAQVRFRGWGRLSQRLINRIKTPVSGDEDHKLSINEILWQTNENFMQIIRNKDYLFKKIIEEQFENETALLNKQRIDELATSPANKKGIWQAIKIVKELEKVLQQPAENIFIEFARSDEESKRSTPRDKFIEKAYAQLKKETDTFNLEHLKELKQRSKQLSSQRLFLYFIQNGKCMYSGEHLDIERLDSYEVDHILPQSYIKDNSIENLALVKKVENQRKKDSLLLNSSIINQNYSRWEQLKNAGLIGEKKFRNLTRTKITDRDKEGFIARQLVETRQITKHVTQLLQQEYKDTTKVFAIKATLVSELRRKFEFIKNRNVNDYHHAQDAFLVAFLGTNITSNYPKIEMEYLFKGYQHYLNEVGKSAAKPKFTFIVENLSKQQYNSTTGEVKWNPEVDIAKLKRILNFKQCNIVRKVEEQSGALFKETIYPVEESSSKTIPLKKHLDTAIYGGYTAVNYASYALIQFKKGRKLKREIIGIPLAVQTRIDNSETSLQTYIAEQIKSEVEILNGRILKYQLISNNGNRLYIAGPSERHNARQLIVSDEAAKVIWLISTKQADEATFLKYYRLEHLEAVFEELIRKQAADYQIFEKLIKKIEVNKAYFYSCTYNEKVKVIEELLKITQANATNGDLKLLKMSNREGRLKTVPVALDFKIINQSVTGLYQSIEDYNN